MMKVILHVIGAAPMFLGAVGWFAGAGAVKRQHLRRMGEETLLFDPSRWSTRNFNDRERSARLRVAGLLAGRRRFDAPEPGLVVVLCCQLSAMSSRWRAAALRCFSARVGGRAVAIPAVV